MRESTRKLLALAGSQGGYFSAAQARELGIERTMHSRYVASGEWVREMRGLYRLADLPDLDPGFSQYHLWQLWGVDKDGHGSVAFAYETAMAIYEISDLQPARVHLSVPRSFRRAVVPKLLLLHAEDRDFEREVWEWQGLKVVRPLQTILDLVREERVSSEHIERGFTDGCRKGLITAQDIKSAKASPRERRLFEFWIK